MDVLVEGGHRHQDVGAGSQLGFLLGLALGHHLVVEEGVGHLAQNPLHLGGLGTEVGGQRRHRRVDLVSQPHRQACRRLGQQPAGQRLVQHHRTQVEAHSVQAGEEELGLVHRRGLEGGDDEEGGAPVVQHPLDGPGPLHEARPHALEEREELGDVGQELAAEDAVGHQVEGLAGRAHQAVPGRGGQQLEEPAGEEVGHARRRLEKVEGVARRRGVDDDQVVAAGLVQLVQPLHGDVLVALHEAA